MSNETDKQNPKSTVLRSVVRATAVVRKIWEEDQLRDMAADHPGGEQPHPEPWRIFASESGLAELLTLIDNAIQPGSAPGYYNVNLPACMELVAAARRVREG